MVRGAPEDVVVFAALAGLLDRAGQPVAAAWRRAARGVVDLLVLGAGELFDRQKWRWAKARRAGTAASVLAAADGVRTGNAFGELARSVALPAVPATLVWLRPRPHQRFPIADREYLLVDKGRLVVAPTAASLEPAPLAEAEDRLGAGVVVELLAERLLLLEPDVAAGMVQERASWRLPEGLTRLASKQVLYAVDTYFRESWEDLCQVAGDGALELCERHALLLLKPDAVVRHRLHAALAWLEGQQLRVVGAIRLRVHRWAVRALWQYQWNAATRDRRDVADLFMPACDSLLLVLRAPRAERPATLALTQMKGPAEPAQCRPGQLRHALGTYNQQLNLVHTADEPADLVRELGICCDGQARTRLFTHAVQARDASGEARRLASELEAEQAPVDLTLTGTVSALRAALIHRYPSRGHATADALREELDAVLAGTSRDWRGVIALGERCGIHVSAWQRVVLGSYLLQPSIEGAETVIPDASAASPGKVALVPPVHAR